MKKEHYDLIKDLSDDVINPTYENQNKEFFESSVKNIIYVLKEEGIETTYEEVVKYLDLLFDEKEREEEHEKEAEEEWQAQLEHEHFETMRVQSF